MSFDREVALRHTDTSSSMSANAIASTSTLQANTSPSLPRQTFSAGTIPKYLWVTDATIFKDLGCSIGDKVGDRYLVIAPQIWLDTSSLKPCNASSIKHSPSALCYLRLHSHSLHLPMLYGVLPEELQTSLLHREPSRPRLLLDNIPVDHSGQLRPSIQENWAIASPVRQVHWLWQLVELWQVLSRWDQTASVLSPSNIRVDGWRVRLVEVWSNKQWSKRKNGPSHRSNEISLPDLQQHPKPLHWHLGQLWQSWVDQGHAALVGPLTQICDQLQQPHCSWNRIKQDLNILLLQQAAQNPLRLAIAGGSHVKPSQDTRDVGTKDLGVKKTGNLCYPNRGGITSGAPPSSSSDRSSSADLDPPARLDGTAVYDVSTGFTAPEPWEELDPYVAIVCDEVSPPSQGNMASQLVTRSLKLQLGAFLTEVESHQNTLDLIAPDVLADQLAAIVRIVNNVLLAQHHSHQVASHHLGLEEQETAGTTATLAVQIPQSVTTPQGSRNGHEIYVVSIGDSRAYWLTPTGCHCLTQDDTVAARTVLSQLGRGHFAKTDAPDKQPQSQIQPRGHQSYHDAQLQAGADTLIQSLGAKEGEQLTIQVRRLIVDEDGVLLLCSHALSDGDRVEAYGQAITTRILRDEITLEQAIQEWLELDASGADGRVGTPHSNSTAHSTVHPNTSTIKEQEQENQEVVHTSVVLMRCQVSEPSPSKETKETFFSASSEALDSTTRAVESALTHPAEPTQDQGHPTARPKEQSQARFPSQEQWRRWLSWVPFFDTIDQDPPTPLPEASALDTPDIKTPDIKTPDAAISDAAISGTERLEDLTSETDFTALETPEDNPFGTLAPGLHIDNEPLAEVPDSLSHGARALNVDGPESTEVNLNKRPEGLKTQAAHIPSVEGPLQLTEELVLSEIERNDDEQKASNTIKHVSLRDWHWLQLMGGCLVMMLGTSAIGLVAWRYFDPVLFDRVVVKSAEQWMNQGQDKDSNAEIEPNSSTTDGADAPLEPSKE